jgi:hypothetical protein
LKEERATGDFGKGGITGEIKTYKEQKREAQKFEGGTRAGGWSYY